MAPPHPNRRHDDPRLDAALLLNKRGLGVLGKLWRDLTEDPKGSAKAFLILVVVLHDARDWVSKIPIPGFSTPAAAAEPATTLTKGEVYDIAHQVATETVAPMAAKMDTFSVEIKDLGTRIDDMQKYMTHSSMGMDAYDPPQYTQPGSRRP